MSNPYQSLPASAFWRPAVGGRNALEIEGLWNAKIRLTPSDRVITAGSCFAQHIGKALVRNGFNWYDAEPGPGPAELDRKYGYGIFSFRTGNIYTAALLRQWLSWAFGDLPDSSEFWEKDGRVFDPFRPAIEPDGFGSVEEMRAARRVTLNALRRAITNAQVFVFTMGLTEGWVNRSTGEAYPMCPGTLAGEFDAAKHEFRNYRAKEIQADMTAVIDQVRRINPAIQILLTVSPVPLTATYSQKHVLVATTYSKSVLRAVAGDLCEDHPFVDYFPSYEIITAPTYGGMFYQPNGREVSIKGVEYVMTHFFAGLGKISEATPEVRPGTSVERVRGRVAARPADNDTDDDDVECEEAVLDAFKGVR